MILITGATGHLGNVLARYLLAKGESIRALVLANESCESLKNLNIEEVEGIISPSLTIPERLAMFITNFTELYYRLSGAIPSITSYSLQTILDNASYCNQKACGELEYNPRNLKESIADTIKWRKESFNKI